MICAWIHVSAPSGGRVAVWTYSTRIAPLVTLASATAANLAPGPERPTGRGDSSRHQR